MQFLIKISMSLARKTLVNSTRPPRQQYNLRIQYTKNDPEDIFCIAGLPVTDMLENSSPTGVSTIQESR